MAAIPPFPGDPILDFAHSLEHVILLTTPQMRNTITVNAGITTVDDLLLLDEESLINTCTAATSAMSKMRLKTLKRWTERQADVDEGALNIQDFTPEICRELQRELARTKKTKDDETSSQGTKEKLTSFNGKAESWGKSKRLLTAYLNQIKGVNGIPLYYVIRDPELELTYRNDNGVIGEMIYDAEHRGRAYEQDAFRVMQILRQWTSGGYSGNIYR